MSVKSLLIVTITLFLILGSTNSIVFNNDNSKSNFGNDELDLKNPSLVNKNNLDWSASGSSSRPAVVTSIDTSVNNEIVVGGLMSGSTTMSMGGTSITSGQYIEPWIAKSDANGNWQWIQQISIIGSSAYADVTLQDLAIAPNGDIFATGMFYDSISFGGINLVSTGFYDFWIAKLSPSGQWQWAEALRGFDDLRTSTTSNNFDVVFGTSIAVDSNNNPIAGGFFLGNTDVGIAADTGAINGDDIEVFVAKYSNFGNLQWFEVARGQGAQEANAMIVDNNDDIWIATTFEQSMTFGSVVANAANNEFPIALAKISSTGTWQAAYSSSGSGNSIVTGFDLDNQNNLLMSGSFAGSIVIGNQLNSAGQDDAFVASMNSITGAWNWAKSVGGTSYDTGSAVQYDLNSGNIILGLSSQSSLTFAGQSFNTRGYNDSVIATFNSNGNEISLADAGSTADDAITGISLMQNGVLVVAGNYNGTIDFGTSSAQSQTTSELMPYVWVKEIVSISDADGDSVADEEDNCPNNPNPGQENTDGDSLGDVCDLDDDNDGIDDDFPDNCPRNSQTGWTSTQDFNDPASSTDWDNDGCKDDHLEDLDDDNDGIYDVDDDCPLTSYLPPSPTWISDSSNDIDGDGCRDSDEDTNDDGDAFEDLMDDCPNKYGTSTQGENGCIDSDGDTWSDSKDSCPIQPGNSSENNRIGCLDQDGDGWADLDDDFIFEKTQWNDTDSDGYGDNPEGVDPDDCIDEAGYSFADRFGCLDQDGDGYSHPDSNWGLDDGADAFPQNELQWSDYDGDGLGDNWGNLSWTDRPDNWPGSYIENVAINEQDACPLQLGSSNQNGIYGCLDSDGDGWHDYIDAFPQETSQWLDSDGDGFGDNLDGFNGDYCNQIFGTSNQDRNGCLDSDGDGYSDVDQMWTMYLGGDVFPDDSSQWSDTDGDGYGDNPGTPNSDDCVSVSGTSLIDRVGCLDFDSDGYSDPSDNWNISQGADACPSTIGNSTMDRTGCFDSDGDGYSNKDDDWSYALGADGYPDDPTRWGIPPSPDSSSFGTVAIAGGGILLLIILGLLMFLRNKKDTPQYVENSHMQMNLVNQQGISTMPQQQNMAQMAIRSNGPPIQKQFTQQSPAKEYYQKLVAQGYPHEYAVAYTKQFFPDFLG